MQDDPGQAESATRLIESLTSEAPGFVSQITVVELNWVPGSAHGLEGSQIAVVVLHLLRTAELVIGQAEQVWKARRLYIAGRAVPGRLPDPGGRYRCGLRAHDDVRDRSERCPRSAWKECPRSVACAGDRAHLPPRPGVTPASPPISIRALARTRPRCS